MNKKVKSESKSKGIRRERILEAALEAFAKRGFEGATWRDIAEAAGVTQGLIRFYFSDKAGLWREAYTLAHDRRIAEMPPSAVQDGKANPEDVATWLRAFARHVAEHPQEARMIVQEGQIENGKPTERLEWAAKTQIRRDHKEFLEAVKALKELGWFQGIEPESLLYLMSGSSQYLFLVPGERIAVSGKDPRKSKAIEKHAEAVVSLFMAHAPR